jgi:hypothetical protein
MNEEQRKRVLFNAQMQLAALRQWLRDQSEDMDDDKKNLILDKMGQLMKLIEELER